MSFSVYSHKKHIKICNTIIRMLLVIRISAAKLRCFFESAKSSGDFAIPAPYLLLVGTCFDKKLRLFLFNEIEKNAYQGAQ